jgi:hypothetical protein
LVGKIKLFINYFSAGKIGKKPKIAKQKVGPGKRYLDLKIKPK